MILMQIQRVSVLRITVSACLYARSMEGLLNEAKRVVGGKT